MAYTHHFPWNLDYSKNKFYRIKIENLEKFQELKRKIESKSKRGKIIEQSEINQMFFLMIDLENEEFKYYLAQADEHYELVAEHFTSPEHNLFEDFQIEGGSAPEEREMPEGLWEMIIDLLFTTLRKDKLRSKPLKINDCIEELLLGMLIHRGESMEPNIKEKYTLYKLAVIAAFIAHKVFNLLPVKEKYSNDQYYEMAKIGCDSAKSRSPLLFEGLTK